MTASLGTTSPRGTPGPDAKRMSFTIDYSRGAHLADKDDELVGERIQMARIDAQHAVISWVNGPMREQMRRDHCRSSAQPIRALRADRSNCRHEGSNAATTSSSPGWVSPPVVSGLLLSDLAIYLVGGTLANA